MFKKNLHLCFFKIKCLPTSLSPPLTLDDDDEEEIYHQEQQHSLPINNDLNKKTLHAKHEPLPLVFTNFNSIYDLSFPSPKTTTTATTTATSSSLSTSSESTTVATNTNQPDISSAFASQRFFVSSPGLSNSILDDGGGLSSSSAASTTDDGGKKLVGGGVPVKKFSPDPYTDFRRSMQEMIEAREMENLAIDNNGGDRTDQWDFLQELLLCYLTLNPKDTHKFIIEAFADVLVSMMSPDGDFAVA